jgi:hypothetical protein
VWAFHTLIHVKRRVSKWLDLDAALPLRPLAESKRRDKKPPVKKPPVPAPAWVALLAAWLGLLTFVAAGVLPFLPGSRNPRLELTHARPYSPADRWLPVPIYASVTAIFIACIVLWQMRREERPLAPALAAQRVQACVGIALALAGIVVIYVFVHLSIAAPTTRAV